MKKFSFSLTDELHQELKDAAKAHNTSMSAICREAITTHLHRQKDPFEQSIEEVLAATNLFPNEEAPSWKKLKSQVWDFLNQPDELLGHDCGFFSKEYIPEIPGFGEDLFGHIPKPTPPARRSPSTRKRTRARTPARACNFNATRFLDEIWA